MRELAAEASVGKNTVVRFEQGRTGMKPGAIARMRSAMEAAGAVFQDDEPKGVRINPSPGAPIDGTA